jgi:hypothetical protein
MVVSFGESKLSGWGGANKLKKFLGAWAGEMSEVGGS